MSVQPWVLPLRDISCPKPGAWLNVVFGALWPQPRTQPRSHLCCPGAWLLPSGVRKRWCQSSCQNSPAFTAEPAKPSNLATFNHSFATLDLSTSLTQHPHQSELTIDIMPILNKNKLRTATADDDPGGGDGVDSSLRIVTLHDNCNGIVDVMQNEVDGRILCGKLTTLYAPIFCPPS